MPPVAVDLSEKLNLFSERWSPKAIAQFEGYQFRLAKLLGDFVWHSHPESDEAFIVLKGTLRIDFRDGAVTLQQGELLVVPKGIEHKPFAEAECHVMILVKAGTVNTGSAPANQLTADAEAWV